MPRQKIAEYLEDFQIGNFLFQTKDGEKVLTGGTLRMESSTLNAAVLSPVGSWDEIDLKSMVIVTLEHQDLIYHIQAEVLPEVEKDEQVQQQEAVPAKNARKLRFEIKDLQLLAQKRRFFRIDSEVGLKCWITTPSACFLVGPTRVNLSGSGLRFMTEETLAKGQRINIQLTLPSQAMGHITCEGRVIRVCSARTAHQEVIVELEKLHMKDQDLLVGLCLAEQRKQLGLRADYRHR